VIGTILETGLEGVAYRALDSLCAVMLHDRDPQITLV
jgi:hypothetical protein